MPRNWVKFEHIGFDLRGGVEWVPRSIRRRPRYKSAAEHPMPKIGLRGEDGWNRGDLVRAAADDELVFSEEIDTDELLVNIDDVDDDDKFVNGASAAYPLPIKPFCLIGVASLKPFCWNSRGCGIFRGFGESNDSMSEPEPEFRCINFVNQSSPCWSKWVPISFQCCPDLHNDGKLTRKIERDERVLRDNYSYVNHVIVEIVKFRSYQLEYFILSSI